MKVHFLSLAQQELDDAFAGIARNLKFSPWNF